VDNIKMDLNKMIGRSWMEFIWLRTGTNGILLWTQWWTFGFHKMLGKFL